MDFASLPPEINSARMYSGAGAAPLLAAAESWETLSADLAQAAADHTSTVTALADAWIGPSASAMTRSATSYAQWLRSTALSAEQSAMQAQAAASAYETAFAATVPPPLIAANRATLLTLITTNLLGQNTAAIMATEALYAEMWAQDVATMGTYQASSAAATSALPQFTQPTQVTKPSTPGPLLQFIQTLIPGFTPGQPLQNLALLLTSPLSSSLLSSGPYETPLQLLSLFTVLWGLNAPSSPLAQAITNRITNTPIELPSFAMRAPEAVAKPSVAIKAGIADGERVGGLSVPPSWAQQREQSTPEHPIATPLAPGESPGLAGLAGAGGLGGLAGLRNNTGNTTGNAPKYGTRLTVMPKHPLGG